MTAGPVLALVLALDHMAWALGAQGGAHGRWPSCQDVAGADAATPILAGHLLPSQAPVHLRATADETRADGDLT